VLSPAVCNGELVRRVQQGTGWPEAVDVGCSEEPHPCVAGKHLGCPPRLLDPAAAKSLLMYRWGR
jgi:hypothetical protein